MSQYQAIKAATNAYIKTNGRREITGDILNAVMIATIDSLGKFYQFAGNAVPDTDPGSIDQNVAFIASTPGDYANLGGLVLNPGEIAVLKYNGQWRKEVIVTLPTRISELANDVGYVTNAVSDLVNYFKKGETFSRTEVNVILSRYYDKEEIDHIVDAISGQSYSVSWDGTAEPIVADIPDGVSVTYGGNPYVGTLEASQDTLGKIYLVSNGAGYDMYVTTENLGFAWVSIGSTNLDLSGYSTLADLAGVDEKVDELSGNFDSLKIVSNNILAPALILDQTTKFIRRTNGTTINATDGYGYTDFIPIPDEGLYINCAATQYGTYRCGILYYDANKAFVGQKSPATITSPGEAIRKTDKTDAVYVRINLGNPSVFAAGGALEGQDYALYKGTEAKPYDAFQEGRELKEGIVTTAKIADGSVTNPKLADGIMTTPKIVDGAVTAPKIADGAVTADKLHPDAVQGAISDQEQVFVGFNLLNPSTSQAGYINKNTGEFVSQSGVLATDFIPVDGKDIYAYCGDSYGTLGGCAVYDENKAYLRANTSTKDYTFQAGDAFIRFTYKTAGYQVICYKPAPTISGTFNPSYDEQVIVPFNGSQVMSEENIPVAMPALSQSGQGGLSATEASLSSSVLSLMGWATYLKNRTIITATAKFSVAGEVRVGLNRNSSTAGYFLRVTATNISICKYTGVDTYTAIKTEAHGLTLSDFITIVFKTGSWDMKAEMMTGSGAYVMTMQNDSVREVYGRPFIEAVGATSLTDVLLRGVAPGLRKPVWFIGDSYTSYYNQRWTTQLKETFGEEDYLVDGLAGASSDDMFPELERLLALGTPRFLVWCLGMNDTSWNWRYYEKKVEMVCRAMGIELILQTIPKPETGTDTKAVINQCVRDSGYRYIDVYSAVCDANGDWYTGMCADGVHPTILGAKAIAARILADLPEICQ